MKTFEELQAQSRYEIRPAIGEDVRPASLRNFPPDDWPIGRNDSLYIAVYFSGDQIVYAPLA